MRPGKGCEECRTRHIKCVVEKGSEACTRCLESDRACHFGPKYRFKQVAHVDSGFNGVRARQELNFGEEQVWVNTRKRLSFILEDGNGLEYGVPDGESAKSATSAVHVPSPVVEESPGRAVPITGLLISEDTSASTQSGQPNLYGLASQAEGDARSIIQEARPSTAPLSMTWDHLQDYSSYRDSGTPRSATAATYPLDFSSPSSIAELQRRHEDGPGVTSTPTLAAYPVGNASGASPISLATPGTLTQPSLSRREAYLVQHFINKIGPWIDVCDAQMHFTHGLPRQAMSRPMVLYAILALASRHLGIMSGQSEEPAEAAFYHGQCLKFVIEQLQGPEALYDDSLLASVVCLRIYEEINFTNDQAHHLAGTDRLMRAIPTFAISGGLGEAACWQSLRQDIYMSMTRSKPPSFNLENFELSSVFTFRDDGACANVVILLFAKVLRLTYTESEQNNIAAWKRMAQDIEAWNDRRLRLFQPIYYEDLDVTQNRPFPIIHCITPPQVAALQYFNACQVFLRLFGPQTEPASSGFHASKRRRALEREVTFHLAAIVGLAEHNPFVENARFTAAHLLRVGGYCIENPLQRTRVIQFLDQVEESMGWMTSHTVALLKEQWQDLDGPKDM
ncbi:hypothetical protein CKM354_001064100 [Cercospora kikuchii]|uniref:Zn(2)-C6 fungal-type domain-containing protein n=1 Tax=Cercospora kikuchii TaxID=84275 RepID=A0A9P3FHB3_9PEZI|nr:uncharacterized protein CKM354_001064100 [Cercospora kikuchii]GIZ47553.1 hypothetical protein CKM354_001064100 [Cercospora kikuchii]